ncbi:fimbrial protein [Pseudomonas fluorescens]|uniref:Major fimbrial subunit SMF-1 n=1 Tax=Pseudomonas fluorescens TaxID=294 RepID=A0A5E7PR07_PSEFL|nr:fimbrial protein [Pseudomonas fluorescens]VVP52034.1 Major fimbrial subunit SMF-1 [Pseudomonas fluorescens]
MKKTVISSLVLGVLIASAQLAMAADGTITINGQVTANTCTIDGNGSSQKDFTVTLPAVSASALGSAGQTAGRTPFSINLSGCTPTSGNVHTYFEAGPTTDSSTGRLVLVGGGASNVQIGLMNNDLTDIKAGFADALQNSKPVSVVSGSATLSYYAQYFATGAATPGAANSSVMYTISYN